MRRRQTDSETISLHWLLVSGFACVLSASHRNEAPERTGSIVRFVSARMFVGDRTWQAASAAVTVSFAYTIYILRSGPWAAASGWTMFACETCWSEGRQAGSANIVLYWIFFVTMLRLWARRLMYFGYVARDATIWRPALVRNLVIRGLPSLSSSSWGSAEHAVASHLSPTGLSAPPPTDSVELRHCWSSNRPGCSRSNLPTSIPPRRIAASTAAKDAELPKDTASAAAGGT